MGAFAPVELGWKGSVYTIPPHRIMGMIARIEETITFDELVLICSRGAMPIGKLCIAYTAVLRYAGARVGEEEVYEHAFSSEAAKDAVTNAAIGLMKMMLPASARLRMDAALATAAAETAPAMEDREPKNPMPPPRALSRKRSRRRWSRANG